MDEAQQAWPEYLYIDYVAAAVRLTTVIQQREQHLLFACVELYPQEIPLPPKGIPSLQKRIGKLATLVSGIAVMPVRDALEWYENALRRQLKVPGIAPDVNVIVRELAPEPALGRLVAVAELPFATRWHCGPRIHHLVPMEDPLAALAWLSPDSRAAARVTAREWVVATLGFDLLAYDEYLFSLVLLAPNPVARRGGPAVVIMSVQDFIHTAAPPSDWLEKAWTGAKQRGLDKLTFADIDAEITSYRCKDDPASSGAS